MPKNSKAKLDANNRYVLKTYETVSTRAKRADRVNDLVDIAAERAGQSKAAYILDAIRARLDADGITPDMLPPMDDTKNDGNP